VRDKVRFCEICGNVSEQATCSDLPRPARDPARICVVEEAKDVVAIERTREFRGLYHVLGGAISPIDGIGPDELRIRQLMQRLADGTVTEVIIATDPNLEGEATATYLSRLLTTLEIRVTRLARAARRRRPRVRRRGHARSCVRGSAASSADA
jgi:recombination protein RecR